MKKYAYMVLEMGDRSVKSESDWLTLFGEKGWELVAVCNGRMYLKRVIDSEPQPPKVPQ